MQTCQQLRLQLQTYIPGSTWTQIIKASVRPGHPLHSAPPGSFPKAATQLAQVQANILNGTVTASRQFQLWQREDWVKVTAKHSHAGDRIMTLHDGAFHLYRISNGTTTADQGAVQLLWKLPCPETERMQLEHFCCKFTWCPNDQMVAAVFCRDQDDEDDGVTEEQTSNHRWFDSTVYMIKVSSRTIQEVAPGADCITGLRDVIFSPESHLVLLLCQDVEFLDPPWVDVFECDTLSRLGRIHMG